MPHTLDLSATFTSLDGKGRINKHPINPEFWQNLASDPSILGTLIGSYSFEADWTHWEMHPEGEEMLIVIDGSLTFLFDERDASDRVTVAAGETLIIPRGTWHRALVNQPGRMIGITFGAGTEHRSLAG